MMTTAGMTTDLYDTNAFMKLGFSILLSVLAFMCIVTDTQRRVLASTSCFMNHLINNTRTYRLELLAVSCTKL